MTGPRSMPPYRALGWLRFTLAMVVVMDGHTAWLAPDNPFASFLGGAHAGGAAVLAFFVISGFVLTEAAATFYRNRPAAFAKNRFLKIVPAFLGALVLSMFIHAMLTASDKLAEGLAAEGVKDLRPIWRSVNITYNPFSIVPFYGKNQAGILLGTDLYLFVRFIWAINVEVMFYVCVFIAVLTAPRWAPLRDDQIRKAVLIYAVAYIVFRVVGMREAVEFYFAFSPYFLFGALLWAHSKSGSTQLRMALVICVVPMAYHFLTSDPFREADSGIAASLIVMGFISLVVMFSKVMVGGRWQGLDRRLGDLSYAVYLNQYSVFILASAFLAPTQRGTFYYLAVAAAVVLLAIAMQKAIEKPLAKVRARVRGAEIGSTRTARPPPQNALTEVRGDEEGFSSWGKAV